jgi:hypothetical protein
MAAGLHPRETGWSRRNLEWLYYNPAGLAVPIPELNRLADRHVVHVHSGKRLSKRKDSGVLFQYLSHR